MKVNRARAAQLRAQARAEKAEASALELKALHLDATNYNSSLKVMAKAVRLRGLAAQARGRASACYSEIDAMPDAAEEASNEPAWQVWNND